MANTAKSDAYKKKSALRSAQHTKARTEQLHEWQLMKEMGKALGLEVPKPITDNPLDKHTNTRIQLTPGLLVILSVRRSTYDPPFQFAYRSNSIMRFTSEIDAKKAARDAGLEVRFVISVSNADGNEAIAAPTRPRPDIQKPMPVISATPYYVSLAENALAQARARI